jgi:hypothetical protein
MIDMGTTKITTGREVVMSDFAVTAFGVILGGMALYMVGAIVALTVFLVRNWGN